MLKGKKPNTLNLRKFINKYQHNIYMLKEEFPNTLIFEIILIITLLLYMLKGKKPNTLIFEIILIITLLLYMLKEEFPNTLKKKHTTLSYRYILVRNLQGV